MNASAHAPIGVKRGCPLCGERGSGDFDQLLFCDRHLLQYLATLNFQPRDLALYRQREIRQREARRDDEARSRAGGTPSTAVPSRAPAAKAAA